MKQTLSTATGRSIREVALVRRESRRLVRIEPGRHGVTVGLRLRSH